MSEVRFSDAAQSDLLDIVVFIARDNPLVAENWLAAGFRRSRLPKRICRGVRDLFSAHAERRRNCSGCAWKVLGS
jgi:plasmid stabilization system protein ParE